MANELTYHSAANSGDTLYAQLENTVGQLWNGSAFEAPVSGSWTNYDIAMTEQATSTGIFRASMPAAAAGGYTFVVRKQAGGSPAVGDIVLGSSQLFYWDGSAVVNLDSRLPAAGAVTNLNTLYDGVEGFAPAYAGPRGPGVYYNDAAGNTNTVDGTDGTLNNPVSTIAAVKTIADSFSFDRVYLVNNSSATLGAAMPDYEFVGIGEMMANTIDLGTQDVDNSHFYNVLITGAQGGTGRFQAEGCVLSAITGMEITACRCLLAAGTLTLRNDCAFDNWWSAVAGSGTPIVDINSVADVNLYMRHGSGGIQINNAVATTVMSLETNGQLVVDASCTGLTVVPRGNLSWTDNGTSTDIKPDAAINLASIAQIQHGTKGTVWFVATDGLAANDGLSPRAAKLSPKTVIEAAGANDVVILGPGTFALGDNEIAVPAGVIVIGAGIDVTVITSTATSGGGKGAIVAPGSNSLVEDLTIKGIAAAGEYQFPYGAHEGNGDAAFTDAVLRRVKLKAETDGYYIKHASACTGIAEDVIIETEFDSVVLQTGDHVVWLIRPKLLGLGPSAADARFVNGIKVLQGTVYAVEPTIHVSGATLKQQGIYASGASSTCIAWNPCIYVGTEGTNNYALAQGSGGTVIVSGGEYDRSKTSGIMTEVSGLDSAMAASPTANSLMQRIQAIDVLTEASGGGDLAANLTNTNRLTAVRAAVLTDWIDAGRLDAILDTINTNAARLTAVRAAILTDWIDGGRLDALLDAVKAKTDNLPSAVAKNVALANFSLLMVDSDDHFSPITGLTVTAQISKDGGAFAGATNSVSEIANGVYKISFTQAEMNADVLVWTFTATGADQRTITVLTDT
jgi:hypothetical protein